MNHNFALHKQIGPGTTNTATFQLEISNTTLPNAFWDI